MLKIGITGGIGAGKSIVSRIIESMGFPVFYSDQEAKIITNSHPKVRTELVRLFGDEVFDQDRLNKRFLAEKIFSNEQNRKAVNHLIHPLVREAFDNFAKNQQVSLVFNEAAILFETGSYKNFDVNVLVTADEEERIKRVMFRDNVTRQEVLARMRNQWSDDRKIELADFLIENNPDSKVLEQVESLIDKLLNQFPRNL